MNYSTKNKEIPVLFNKKKHDSDNKCNNTNLSTLARQYSSFVFLVSMKYLKDEEKSKETVLKIFNKLNILLQQTEIKDIKAWLYGETKSYCLTYSN